MSPEEPLVWEFRAGDEQETPPESSAERASRVRREKDRRLALTLLMAALGTAAALAMWPGGRLGVALNARLATPSATAADPAPVATIAGMPLSAESGAPSPSVTRPYAPGLPRQLLEGGCCPGAWWSLSSTEILYVDRPSGAPGTAIYGVPVWPPGSQPRAVDTRLNLDGSARYIVRTGSESTTIEDQTTGATWDLPTDGRRVLLSPSGQRAVWWAAGGDRQYLDSLVTLYGAAVDGSGVRELLALWGLEVVAFHPDDTRVLVVGRPVRGRSRYTLALVDTVSGSMQQLAHESWITGASLSRTGDWVAYMVTLDPANSEANGVWLVSTTTLEKRKLPFFGAYRWRDGQRLVYVPMEPGTGVHTVWQYDAGTGSLTRLLDPNDTPLLVANNDWSVSPDGLTMAYVAQEDRNVWLVDLP